MHMLIGAAGRRAAGLAAGVILTGGLVGGVLLTPGPAFADTTVGTTTAITGTTQTSTGPGNTLTVQVSVTAASGSVAPSGNVDVSAGPGDCTVTLTPGPNGAGAGHCNIANLAAGNYTVTAAYRGSAGFSPSNAQATVKIGGAPTFVAASPPLTATAGQGYSYTFGAKAFPPPSYALGSGSPGWLHINPHRGTVWGTVPWGISSFSYSVTAYNSFGSVTAGPFTVWVKQGHIDINTSLSCPHKVGTGLKGSCTLWVTNHGSSPAPDVTAQIALPSPLRADFCVPAWNCWISDNTAHENLGTLYPGQTDALTVVFTAKTGWSLWGWHRGHQFTVKVVGFAAAHGDWWIPGQRESYSVAYVTIFPRGWWAG